ncbi:MAG TPA: alpha/beta hydrolase [Chitinophagaceae bacterium]
MKVYFISGLAADRRVFKHIRLPEGYEVVHLDWLPPHAKETLYDYAMRMSEGIDRSEPFALLGLSFGGMLAVEIAKKYAPEKMILVSSVPAYRQLPGYFHFAGRWGLHKLIPVSLVKKASLLKRLFTAETSEDKEMLRELIRDSDNHFIYWAMDAILRWRGEEGALLSYIHIHGTWDEVLPIRFTKPTHRIPKAGHLMIMNRADELNRIIADYLKAGQ